MNQTITQNAAIEDKIDQLLSQMTLDEKIGQTAMRGTSSREKGPPSEALKNAVREGQIGTMLNIMNKDYIEELQRIAVEESKHGIPIIFARDIVHGFKTIFPIPLGVAATFDPSVAETTGRISAYEGTGLGIRWTFAPMLDIVRDSRWGRVAESPGEDPYLASLLAKAYVKGFQGDDITAPTSMAACAKHFLGYGAAEGGRDYNTTIIHEPLLRNVYIPPFQAAVDAGALTVMSSFNEVNGIPVSGSEYLLKEVLRDELGFDGLIVSDWNSVIEMIAHGVAEGEKEAAYKAVNAGLDIEMTSRAYERHIKGLIEEGTLKEEQLNFLVRNILRVKLKMGLFDKPYRDKTHTGNIYADEHLEAAKNAAMKSMVLLKNDGLLPLANSKKVAIIGPLADAPREQLGTWTFDGEGDHSITPATAFKDISSGFVPCLAYSRDKNESQFEDAVKLAEQSDVVLFFGGEEAILSGEAHSRANIDLPGKQIELIHKLAETGKPIVLVIMAGRPISIMNVIDKVDAVLMAWHPGTMAGPALFDVITGVSEPGGRLPITWPKAGAQSPIYYNHKNTGRPANINSYVTIDSIPVGAWQSSLGNESHYLDLGFQPHFPFGYGLTYTTFEYSNMKLSSATITEGEELTITVDITNTGNRKGKETAQLYIQDKVGSITRPVRELKRFQAIDLEPGETKNLSFQLHTDDLKYVNHKVETVLEPGAFNIWIGPNSMEGLKGSFRLK